MEAIRYTALICSEISGKELSHESFVLMSLLTSKINKAIQTLIFVQDKSTSLGTEFMWSKLAFVSGNKSSFTGINILAR